MKRVEGVESTSFFVDGWFLLSGMMKKQGPELDSMDLYEHESLSARRRTDGGLAQSWVVGGRRG